MLDVLPLARRPAAIELVRQWFESEWPAWYGPGGPGDAHVDLLAYAQEGALPLGLLALRDVEPVGFAALKREPFPTHPHLTPWASAAVVLPALRRQGIGRALLDGLASQARTLGFRQAYCATATAESLLLRAGWQRLDTVQHEGRATGIYAKAL